MVVPIWQTDAVKSQITEKVLDICEPLITVGIRVHIDDRDNLTAGYKFNDWEMRGVPLRMEIGINEVLDNTVTLARRDIPGREGKQTISNVDLIPKITRRLNNIQRNMLRLATEFRDENTRDASSYDAFKEMVQDGWALIWHCGTAECEDKIKEETKASSRCYPLDSNATWHPKGEVCTVCGKPAEGKAYFGRAY